MSSFKIPTDLDAQFRALMKSRPIFVPSNVRKYSWQRIAFGGIVNGLGFRGDAHPVTGTIVHSDADLLILKIKPSEYAVIDPALLPHGFTPTLGQCVTITPYGRKSLDDFKRLDAFRPNGDGTQTMLVGVTRTSIPNKPQKGYLCNLAQQLEALKMPDGYRTVANALADWHAKDFEWIDDDSILDFRLKFHVTSPKYVGDVTIKYNRVPDDYTVILNNRTLCETAHFFGIYFDQMSAILSDIAGDEDSWFRVSISTANKLARAA
jgi:hypothetical protein